MGLIINSQEVTRIELGGVEVLRIEDGQGRILYESGPKYLCFESLANGSYVGGNGRSGVTLECSTDKQNWTPWDWEVYTYLDEGDKLYVRGTNSYISTSNNLFRFQMSGSIAASGDLTTILDPDGNVTTLADYCFNSIFNGCSALTTAPDMSSVTSIGDYGCRAMFNDCTSLTTAPDMSNVATAGQWAMAGMFEGCTSLATAPDLRNLTSVGSYGCLSLYSSCSLMSTVYAPSITAWNTTNFQGWMTSVAASGTMWKPASLTIPSGRDGIPSGWTTQNYN